LPGGFTKDEVEALGLDYPVNLEKARKLLAEAGYPEGFSLEVVTSEVSQEKEQPFKYFSPALKVSLNRKSRLQLRFPGATREYFLLTMRRLWSMQLNR